VTLRFLQVTRTSLLALMVLLGAARPLNGQNSDFQSSSGFPIVVHSAASVMNLGQGVGFAPAFGIRIARRWNFGEWVILGFSALLPPEGGFTRLDTGMNYTGASFYGGGGVGISRFDLDQPFVYLCVGRILSLGAVPFRLEGRYERHSHTYNGGSMLSLGIGPQLR
jgi:hypothetical protein